jgi:asparagine synthase (glutamine-hydrolysing)
MCGILAVIGSKNIEQAQTQARKLAHRGPDERDSVFIPTYPGGAILCHERLSIVDLKTGKQPIQGTREDYIIHNGEIYNHKELREKLLRNPKTRTTSDSEIIIHLWEEHKKKTVTMLDGVFSFVIVDGREVFAARDPIGVKPLFYGHDINQAIWFASEQKALIDVCTEIHEFPPGHYYHTETGFVRYYKPTFLSQTESPTNGPERLNELLTKAVHKRLMSDAPLGVLLSGGLDSSLVTSIVVREAKKKGQTVKSFSVGMDANSLDLKKARAAANFLGTEHHEVIFTSEQGIKLLDELIYKTESYDVTTTRAATPMLILSKYIASLGVKVVLSGEGADEIFGGYLYFLNAPGYDEFHQECVRRVRRLHTSDVLRADRATMGSGVEARVPFLDKDFLEYAMAISPKYKFIKVGEHCEKFVLRNAFDTPENPYLPSEVLWRQKEQFSDGVGYSWIDDLKQYAQEQISDEMFAMRGTEYSHNCPETKEAYLYRKIYDSYYSHPSCEKIIKTWVPKWQDNKDPSGRANTVHLATTEDEKEAFNSPEITL